MAVGPGLGPGNCRCGALLRRSRACGTVVETRELTRVKHSDLDCEMTDLPPDLAAFASLLDAQPEPARAAFAYCLALAMVQAGEARLVETRAGDTSPVCVFETIAGDFAGLVLGELACFHQVGGAPRVGATCRPLRCPPGIPAP